MKKWLWLMLPFSAPLFAHGGPHVIAPPVANIAPDGDFADWPKDVEWHAIESPDPGSLAARFAIGVDRARGLLNVAVDVTDDVLVLDGDGVDIYVDVPHRAARDLAARFSLREDFSVGNPRFDGAARGV